MKQGMLKATGWMLPVLGLAVLSCSRDDTVSRNAVAKAEITGYLPNTQGGTVWIEDASEKGTRIKGEVSGLMPDREYAIHIHEVGDCSSPQASGNDFDPVSSGRHGVPGAAPGSRHAGDLPNIRTDKGGKAEIDLSSHLLGTGDTEFSIIGKSIIIHAEKDDFQSQPDGGAGEKIACGVIRATGG